MKKQNKTGFNKLVLDLKSQHIHLYSEYAHSGLHSGVMAGLALVS